jgi:hypothetical protein
MPMQAHSLDISSATTLNNVYAGLRWTLNQGTKPEAVIGFRHANTTPVAILMVAILILHENF